jgi:hypothetical protein
MDDSDTCKPSINGDINCGSQGFLLFSAKDLVANDAAKLNATIDQATHDPAHGVRRAIAAGGKSTAPRGR